MNRVREASTMSVPTMRQMLGLKKTASYWLIKKQWFDVLIIHGEMRVVISSRKSASIVCGTPASPTNSS